MRTTTPPAYNTGLRLLAVALLALALAACSRVQLAYSNLDWLLPRYLASYMPLSDHQDEVLETRVDGFLRWHCSTQVAGYATLLRDAGSRLQSPRLSRDELESFSDRIVLAWADIMQRAGRPMAEILETADEEQVRALFDGFEERNREWQQDFQAQSGEQRRRDYRKRMKKELRRWVGGLDAHQEQLLVTWSEGLRPLGMERLELRRRWQDRLRELMQRRSNREDFRAGFAKLLDDPAPLRTPLYQQRLDHNHRLTIDLLYKIARSLDAEQQRHLQYRVDVMSGDLGALACSDDVETVASR